MAPAGAWRTVSANDPPPAEAMGQQVFWYLDRETIAERLGVARDAVVVTAETDDPAARAGLIAHSFYDGRDAAEAFGELRALIEANPDRIIWGTDWPHPIHYRGMPNDAYLLDQLLDWTDEATTRKILVDNPQQLFGFLSTP